MSSWAWDDKWTWTNKLTKFSGFTHSLFFLLSHDNNLRSHAPLLTFSAPLPVPHRKDSAHGTLCLCTVASINQRSRNTVLSSSSIFHFFVNFCGMRFFSFSLTPTHVWGAVSLTRALIAEHIISTHINTHLQMERSNHRCLEVVYVLEGLLV